MAVKTLKSPAQVGIEAFRNIAERWHLTIEQQAILMGTSGRTLYDWYRAPERAPRDRDKLERISYILGVFSGLAKVYGDTENAYAWLRRPNEHFVGRTPLDRMLDGNVGDLAEVRMYVDRFANLL